jgi:hypothetical protein
MRIGQKALVLVGGLCLAVLAGCEASPWERGYEASGAASPPRGKGAPVVLREVPWERLRATLEELNAERIASDIHPDEWSGQQKEAAHARLLRGLQVSADPRTVEVLGRSAFNTTWAVRPGDGELEGFARSRGATMVVWSSTYVGKADVIEKEPVTGWSTGTDRHRGPDGKWRSETSTHDSTIWVPVAVQKDEHAWMAYFLRESGRE